MSIDIFCTKLVFVSRDSLSLFIILKHQCHYHLLENRYSTISVICHPICIFLPVTAIFISANLMLCLLNSLNSSFNFSVHYFLLLFVDWNAFLLLGSVFFKIFYGFITMWNYFYNLNLFVSRKYFIKPYELTSAFALIN